MIFTVPNSNGEADHLEEANPCHSERDGTFTAKGQGRCLGVEARVAARQDFDRTHGALPRGKQQNTGVLGDPAKPMRPAGPRMFTSDDLTNLRLRRETRNYLRSHPAPTYMQQDIKDARRADAAIVMVPEPGGSLMAAGHDDSRAFLDKRVAIVEPAVDTSSKPAQLTTLRHELGHLDRTPLGVGGHSIGGLRVSDTFAEEVRAWKNALRNSGGKIRMSQMYIALHSYMRKEPGVWAGAGDESAHAARLMDTHVIPVLQRYRDRIRRAAKAA